MAYYPWKNMDVVPRAGLQAWHQYEEGVSANNLVNDYSGNNRHLTCSATNAPVLTPDLANGQPGWVWNGTNTIPLAFSGSLNIQHLFIVVSHFDALFSTTKYGLLSDINVNSILLGSPSGDDNFQALAAGLGYTNPVYRKSDVVFADNNQNAPMSGAHAVVEAHFDTRTLNGIQVGKLLTDAASLWKGTWFELLMYDRILSLMERQKLYWYFAMRYHLWPKTAAGLNVFPFIANKTQSVEIEREHYLSEPYSGPLKALVRGSFENGYQCQFLIRRQQEFEAAKAFFKAHYPLTDFVFRDYRYFPAQDVQVRFASPIREQGTDVTYRFNYTFDLIQTA